MYANRNTSPQRIAVIIVFVLIVLTLLKILKKKRGYPPYPNPPIANEYLDVVFQTLLLMNLCILSHDLYP